VNASQFDVNAQKSERIYSKIFTFFKPEGVGNLVLRHFEWIEIFLTGLTGCTG